MKTSLHQRRLSRGAGRLVLWTNPSTARCLPLPVAPCREPLPCVPSTSRTDAALPWVLGESLFTLLSAWLLSPHPLATPSPWLKATWLLHSPLKKMIPIKGHQWPPGPQTQSALLGKLPCFMILQCLCPPFEIPPFP